MALDVSSCKQSGGDNWREVLDSQPAESAAPAQLEPDVMLDRTDLEAFHWAFAPFGLKDRVSSPSSSMEGEVVFLCAAF